MHIKYTAKTAFRGLATNKTRSFLTLLGIVIGIAAVILVISLGQGAQNLILSQIQSMGPKVIAVVPGRQPKGLTDIIATFTDSLKEKDVQELQKSHSKTSGMGKYLPEKTQSGLFLWCDIHPKT